VQVLNLRQGPAADDPALLIPDCLVRNIQVRPACRLGHDAANYVADTGLRFRQALDFAHGNAINGDPVNLAMGLPGFPRPRRVRATGELQDDCAVLGDKGHRMRGEIDKFHVITSFLFWCGMAPADGPKAVSLVASQLIRADFRGL